MDKQFPTDFNTTACIILGCYLYMVQLALLGEREVRGLWDDSLAIRKKVPFTNQKRAQSGQIRVYMVEPQLLYPQFQKKE